jgi:uroporphyrinogen-III decarboxylase
LTSKERLAAVFNHQLPDRVPVWMMFPFEKESIAADVHTDPSYQDVTKLVVEKTDFIERNTLNVEYVGAEKGGTTVDFLFNHPEVDVDISNDGRSYRKQVEYNNIKFEKSVLYKDDGTSVSSYLKDIGDIYNIMDLPYEIPRVDLKPYLRKAENLGDKGLHGILIIDPISVFHDICGEMDFIIWASESTSTIEEFLESITPRMVAIYTQFLENQVGEVFFLSGPEYLSPPLASPEVFHRLVTVYTKKIFDLIRSYGKKSILHCHGNVKNLFKEIKMMGPDALQPIEPPPFGDCTLAEARRELGDDMILIGNIEYTDLAEKEADEITALVKSAIEQGGRKNFILCPSCTPYEEQISEKTAQNYIAMIKAGVTQTEEKNDV